VVLGHQGFGRKVPVNEKAMDTDSEGVIKETEQALVNNCEMLREMRRTGCRGEPLGTR
jgi:hypothetical protein